MNDKTDSQKVAEIVAAGVEAGSDDDSMLIEIVQSGIKFKVAGKLFKQAMTEGGYRITAKDRKEKGRGILVDAEFAPETYDEFQKMVEQLVSDVNDTSTSQAHSIIKSYAKEFEIEVPKPPKKVSGGFRTKAHAWMIANVDASKDDLAAWIEEAGKDDPEGKLLQRTWDIFAFGKAMRAADPSGE